MKKFITVTSIVVLAIVLATMLMACTPSEDSLKKKYEEEGYIVVSGAADDIPGYDAEDAEIKYVLVATKVVKNVVIVCFGNSDDAKACYDEIKGDGVKKKGNAIAIGDEESLELF